ncbi:hypothetical protein [Anaerorhabdus sp.]|uniref:hypothetical protein n=1 Tax=Anaerorhabdus sp. TaxID=1872524 RepID=UPI002FC5DCCE
MKKILSLLVITLTFVGAISAVSAQEGYIEDDIVAYNYWDQNNIGTYWTGVVNKVDYDQFAPCVGAKNAGYTCGAKAYQSQYKEFGLGVNAPHVHCLHSSEWGMQYLID